MQQEFQIDMVKEKVDKENTMFALIQQGVRDKIQCNPAQLHTQLTFRPAQLASKIANNFNFFPAPCQKASPMHIIQYLQMIYILIRTQVMLG